MGAAIALPAGGNDGGNTIKASPTATRIFDGEASIPIGNLFFVFLHHQCRPANKQFKGILQVVLRHGNPKCEQFHYPR